MISWMMYILSKGSQKQFKNGVVVAISTEDALIKKVSCPWISEGTLKIKINTYEFLLELWCTKQWRM